MKNVNFKYKRLSEDIKRVLSQKINEDIDSYFWVTITDVELTKDLGDVKIFFEVINSDDEDKALEKMQNSSKYFKKVIANEIKIRRVPNILFYVDKRLDNYNKIEALLKKGKEKNGGTSK